MVSNRIVIAETLQGYDLRQFKGSITVDCNGYDDGIRNKQRKLYELIGTDQVIWCVLDSAPLCRQEGNFLHRIEVDPRDVVRVVDALIWCNILGYGQRYIPPQEHAELRKEVALSGPV